MNRQAFGSAKRVGAVVVTFHPAPEATAALLEKLIHQVDRIVVVDNGSSASVFDELRRCTVPEKISVMALDENRGIAVAHNIGIASLLESRVDYVLLVDQDSTPAGDMVQLLVNKAEELTACGIRLAAVGPVFIDSRTQTLSRVAGAAVKEGCKPGSVGMAEGVCETDFLISSGCLLTKEAVNEIGLMNEDYFIDHVDTEWCLRAISGGWRVFYVAAAKMTHTLGDDTVQIWFGRRRQVAIHSPLRNYYELRNTILMLRNVPMSQRHRWFHSIRIVQFLFFFGLVTAPRQRRLKMMLTGIWHGMLGRAGKFEEH